MRDVGGKCQKGKRCGREMAYKGRFEMAVGWEERRTPKVAKMLEGRKIVIKKKPQL